MNLRMRIGTEIKLWADGIERKILCIGEYWIAK